MFRRVLYSIGLLVFLAVPLGVPAEEDFSSIFVFGDSLSDNGNMANLAFVGIIPEMWFLLEEPYDLGFSNGPRAVEVLARELDLPLYPSNHLIANMPEGTNFAIVAARAVTLGEPPTIDLPTQIQAFLHFLNSQDEVDFYPEDALYVVFIGGNDIRYARDERDNRAAADMIIEAVTSVETALEALVSAGARHLLVANAPDIGGIPETHMIADAPGKRLFSKRATWLTRMFNWKLKQAVLRIEREFSIRIIEFNTFRFLRFILRNHEVFGFDNTKDACYLSFFEPVQTYNPGICENETDFARFVYFDEIHPTAKVHSLVGRAMVEAVEDEYSDEYRYND